MKNSKKKLEQKAAIELAKKKATRKKIFAAVGTMALFTGVGIAAIKILDSITTKKNNRRNSGSSIKKYSNYLGAKSFSSNEVLDGVILKSFMGANKLDFTNASFKDDAFVSISGCFSAIHVVVPNNIQVRCDSLLNKTAFKNETAAYDENSDLPTLFIAINTSCSAIHITYER